MIGRKLTVAALISTESGGIMREEPVLHVSNERWQGLVQDELAERGWT